MKYRIAQTLQFVSLSMICCFIAGCREGSTAPTTAPAQDTVRMQIGNETFTLEVADSDEEQQRGLMDRPSMPADHGMIFVFNDARRRGFWMKNTHIPLDIIYVESTGFVDSVKHMKPLDRTTVPSDGNAMYAIELNEGAAARVGVKAGDVLTIPPEILSRQSRK